MLLVWQWGGESSIGRPRAGNERKGEGYVGTFGYGAAWSFG